MDGARWRQQQDRTRAYEQAYLARVEKMPTLDSWLGEEKPQLSAEQVEQNRADMAAWQQRLNARKRQRRPA